MNHTDIVRRAEFASRLADAAGETLRRYFRAGPIESSTKNEVSSIVTIADTEAERVMRKLIAETFPNDGIIGEEDGAVASKNGISWVLDPIDGTSSFVRGLPVFGILIGCVEEQSGKVLCGVLDQPILRERFAASVGGPAMLNGAIIASPFKDAEQYSNLDQVCLCSTTPLMFVTPQEQESARKAQAACKRKAFGGDCYNYAMLAAGTTAMPLVVLESDMKYYDFCALVPLIEGAGGIISDWSGAPLTKESTQVLAAPNRALWQMMLSVIV